MPHAQHRSGAPRSVRVSVVTASDTGGEVEDASGVDPRAAAATLHEELPQLVGELRR